MVFAGAASDEFTKLGDPFRFPQTPLLKLGAPFRFPQTPLLHARAFNLGILCYDPPVILDDGSTRHLVNGQVASS